MFRNSATSVSSLVRTHALLCGVLCVKFDLLGTVAFCTGGSVFSDLYGKSSLRLLELEWKTGEWITRFKGYENME